MRIREAGDSALLLEVETLDAPAIDAEINARVIAIADRIRELSIPGVRDVLSTFRSVAIFFDPLATDVAAITAALPDGEHASAPAQASKIVDVPIVYGGEAGPDLDEVADFAGCSSKVVIERHAARIYRVYMLGFLPGFPYMASVDETIAAPRRAAPRLRVPAGSVGIAGRQTGIYPQESPGGWQIIGKTALSLFDPGRAEPSLFAPGDRVRFVPTSSADVVSAFRRTLVRLKPDTTTAGATATASANRYVTVLQPGLLTTVQDSGRWGYQSLGVPVSGPMDGAAHRLANAIVGNLPDAATLEATLLGPHLRMEEDTWIALAGADLNATLDGAAVPVRAAVSCQAGSVLRFSGRRAGARVYVAFDGGIAVPRVLGSRATHVLGGLGGIDGRAVQAGDRLPLGAGLKVGPPNVRSDDASLPAGGARLRVLAGPQSDSFEGSALDQLLRTRYTISPQSDRMGYRLVGGASLPRTRNEMISDAMFAGGVQVPPSGDPILLMADRQTTGGYPQLAIVITADLPLAAQLVPGDWVEFEACARAEAISALIAQEGKPLAVR